MHLVKSVCHLAFNLLKIPMMGVFAYLQPHCVQLTSPSAAPSNASQRRVLTALEALNFSHKRSPCLSSTDVDNPGSEWPYKILETVLCYVFRHPASPRLVHFPSPFLENRLHVIFARGEQQVSYPGWESSGNIKTTVSLCSKGGMEALVIFKVCPL